MDLRKEMETMVSYILPEDQQDEDIIANYTDTLCLIAMEYCDFSLGDVQKIGWTDYNWDDKSSHPPCPGRYLIYRIKCDKIHFERWNGSGWSSTNNEKMKWTSIKTPD